MNVNEDDNAELGEVNVGFTPRSGIESVTYIRNQQERERQMREAREHHSHTSAYRGATTAAAASNSINPIYDNPDNGVMGGNMQERTMAGGYSASSRRYAATTTSTSGQRIASGSEGINMSVEDDEERLMARSTLTSDQSRIVSARNLQHDNYEAPRSYSYSYAYSREFAANQNLNNGNNTTSSTASHL